MHTLRRLQAERSLSTLLLRQLPACSKHTSRNEQFREYICSFGPQAWATLETLYTAFAGLYSSFDNAAQALKECGT